MTILTDSLTNYVLKGKCQDICEAPPVPFPFFSLLFTGTYWFVSRRMIEVLKYHLQPGSLQEMTREKRVYRRTWQSHDKEKLLVAKTLMKRERIYMHIFHKQLVFSVFRGDGGFSLFFLVYQLIFQIAFLNNIYLSHLRYNF